jgi:hypothetical protein
MTKLNKAKEQFLKLGLLVLCSRSRSPASLSERFLQNSFTWSPDKTTPRTQPRRYLRVDLRAKELARTLVFEF